MNDKQSNFSGELNSSNNSNKGNDNFQLSQIFSIRWIRILAFVVFLISLFIVSRFISSELSLLFVAVLPLFIGAAMSYFIEPLIRFFNRFLGLRISQGITYFLLFCFTISLTVGLFILFFIQVDRLFTLLLKGQDSGQIRYFIKQVGEPDVKLSDIDSMVLNTSGNDFTLELNFLGPPDESWYAHTTPPAPGELPTTVTYVYKKTDTGGIYNLLFTLITNIPQLKNVLLGLIRSLSSWNKTSYIDWLFSNYLAIFSFAYIFLFSLLITLFMMGKGGKFYRFIWNFFMKNQPREIAQKLEIRLKKNMTAWLRGLVVDEIYIFSFTLLFIFLAGLIWKDSSSYLENSLTLAIFMAIFNLIPYFGPWVGLGLIASVGMADAINFGTGLWSDWLPFIMAVSGAFIVQIGESAIVAPLVYSHQVKLRPPTIIIGLASLGVVFGIFVMPFVIPLILFLKIVLFTVYKKEWNI